MNRWKLTRVEDLVSENPSAKKNVGNEKVYTRVAKCLSRVSILFLPVSIPRRIEEGRVRRRSPARPLILIFKMFCASLSFRVCRTSQLPAFGVFCVWP